MKARFKRISPAYYLLGGIILLSLGLHFYNIQSIGDANTYYTAAVKSMLQSWKNFFFVAAEPGGSVTVDKPPLGLWIEAGFAAVFGVNGFSVVLPNIIAGVLSIPMLFMLVRRYFGEKAGLIAAFVLAITPVCLAVDRNNTVDGMLIFTLLLAAWAFLQATETGKFRFLAAGAVLVGIGFNIKMLQAFLPLPAFYLLYFLGAKNGWLQKILHLGLASILLVIISLSWAVIVDLTPSDQRPYVGSSENNSELSLILGYNGINRLLGNMGGSQRDGNPQMGMNPAGMQPGRMPPGGFQRDGSLSDDSPLGGSLPAGAQPPATGLSQLNPPPAGGGAQDARLLSPTNDGPGDGGMAGGGGMGFPMGEIGTSGMLRFFQTQLAKEMSWLLPFVLLLMIPGLALQRVRLPFLSDIQKGLVLWGTWLLTCLVFFSAAQHFHTYYLAMLAPALGALAGGGYVIFTKIAERNRLLAAVFWFDAAGITLAYQLILIEQYGLDPIWISGTVVFFSISALLYLAFFIWMKDKTHLFHLATALSLLSICIIPTLWSMKTVSADSSNRLPAAYAGDKAISGRPGGNQAGNPPGNQAGNQFANPVGEQAGNPGPGGGENITSDMVTYLQAHTQNVKYLVAVPSSMTGSSLVLETGRPVLFMGGFNGSDSVIDAQGLEKLVTAGELRYILYGGGGPGMKADSSGISTWLTDSCQVVTAKEISTSSDARTGRDRGATLYRCE